MEIITLDQPTYKKSKKDGKEHIYLSYILSNGEKKSYMNTTEKSFVEMKQAVVNVFLKEGYRAPQNEIAKYITQDAYAKKVRTGQAKHTLTNSIDYTFDYEIVPGPKLVMTRGK